MSKKPRRQPAPHHHGRVSNHRDDREPKGISVTEKLYHFTSVAGLYGIVESGELRPHQIDFRGFG